MTIKKLTVIPALLALSACGGGGSTDIMPKETSPTPETMSLSVPQASGDRTEYETVDALLSALPNLKEGDEISIPLEEVSDVEVPSGSGNLTLTVGETTNGVTLITSNLPAFADSEGSADFIAVSGLQAFADLIVTDPTNQEFTALLSENVNGTEIEIAIVTADNDYYKLASEAGLTVAEVIDQPFNGSAYKQIEARKSAASFTSPSGSFDYSGKSALGVSDEVAVGDVTMRADFDAGTATIAAPSLAVVGSETTAGFNGSVVIDNASGRYASSSASITIDDQNYDAGIIGVFSSDASISSGSVFDADQSTASGVFSVVQD